MGERVRPNRGLAARARLLRAGRRGRSRPVCTSATGSRRRFGVTARPLRPSRARCRSRRASCASRVVLNQRRRPDYRDRRVAADMGGGRARGGGGGGAASDRARRRLPGQPRPAPLRAVRRRSERARRRRSQPLCVRSCPSRSAGDGWTIVSASPELFLARRGRRVWTMPIKGTRPAGRGDELRESAKDAAEHVMIVDLERNDLSRVCEPGSDPLAGADGDASARRRRAHGLDRRGGAARGSRARRAARRRRFPGGSVTGAPKIAAVDHIAALEPVGRGASMGALGRVRGNGDLELALTIRTFAVAAGRDPPVGRRRHRLGLRPCRVRWRSRWRRRGRCSTRSARRCRSRARPCGAAVSTRPLAVAVSGRGLVDPAEPVLRRRRRGLPARPARRSRRYASTTARPFRLAAAPRSAGALGGERSACRRRTAPSRAARQARARARRCAPTPCSGSTGRPGRPERRSRWRWRSSPPSRRGSTTQRGAWPAAGLAPVPAPFGALAAAGTKSTSYAVNSRRRPRRRRRGADDAVFVDADGIVLEGPVTNVWWRRGQRFCHAVARPRHPRRRNAGGPPRARAAGSATTSRRARYPLDDLLSADEAFTSSSVREVMPVVAVDGRVARARACRRRAAGGAAASRAATL